MPVCVLGEVVGTEADEVEALLDEVLDDERSGCNLDHYAPLDVLVRLEAD